MAWTYRGESAAGAAAQAQDTDLVTAGDGGVQEGDLIVALVAIDNSSSVTITPRESWDGSQVLANTVQCSGGLYWKVAGASEPSNYAFQADAATNFGIRLAVFNPNGDTITVAASSKTDTTTESATVSTTAITVVAGVDSEALFIAGFNNDSGGGITTAPSTPTGIAIVDDLLNATSTPGIGAHRMAMYYELGAPAGSTTSTMVWDSSDENGAFALTAYLTAAASGGSGPLINAGLINAGLINRGLIG